MEGNAAWRLGPSITTGSNLNVGCGPGVCQLRISKTSIRFSREGVRKLVCRRLTASCADAESSITRTVSRLLRRSGHWGEVGVD